MASKVELRFQNHSQAKMGGKWLHQKGFGEIGFLVWTSVGGVVVGVVLMVVVDAIVAVAAGAISILQMGTGRMGQSYI